MKRTILEDVRYGVAKVPAGPPGPNGEQPPLITILQFALVRAGAPTGEAPDEADVLEVLEFPMSEANALDLGNMLTGRKPVVAQPGDMQRVAEAMERRPQGGARPAPKPPSHRR